MYFVYILQCSDNSLYTGITTNLARRLTQHKKGIGGSYTRSHGAVQIMRSEAFPDRSSASKREHEIKQMKRAQKLQLISKT